MKNKLFFFSAILLISIMVAGGTFAWFTSSPMGSEAKAKMGIVDVEVIQDGLDKITIKNLGTSDSYIRVRLVPQWSESSLSVSNVKIEIRNNWIEKDGYYYYKNPVKANKKTTDIIKNIDFSELTPEYEGATFTLKVVAEGVQSTHQAWKDVWSISNLPF